jgi:predicted GTPase
VDEEFYKTIVQPHAESDKPFFFVLTQADKIEPFREWNEKDGAPGPNQLVNLEKRRQYVAKCFDVPLSKVLCISSSEEYRLANLIEEIVFALPDEKKVGLVREVRPELVSQRAKVETKKGFVRTVSKALSGVGLGAAIGSVIPGVGTVLGAAIGGVLGFLFG